MFESGPTDLSIERLKMIKNVIDNSLQEINLNTSPRDVHINIDWEVKTVNGKDELVPKANISFTT